MVFLRFFIDVAKLPSDIGGLIQVLSLCCLYGILIYYATRMLVGGSRLLLLNPKIASLVYNLLLPLITAIPTGSMVLAAGMGRLIDELDMSMGILAGSTIGHVTVWWFLTVFWGRVTVDHGDALTNGSMDPIPRYRSPKLVPVGSLDPTGTGVSTSIRTHLGAQMAFLSLCPYLFMLLPSIGVMTVSEPFRAQAISIWAFLALVVCAGLLGTCLWYFHATSGVVDYREDEERVIEDAFVEAILEGHITLKGLMYRWLRREGADAEAPARRRSSLDARRRSSLGQSSAAMAFAGLNVNAAMPPSRRTIAKTRLYNILKPHHRKFADAEGVVDLHGLCAVLRTLGETTTSAEVERILAYRGRHPGPVSNYKDFVDNVVSYLVHPVEDNYESSTPMLPPSNHNHNGEGRSYDSHDNNNHNNNHNSQSNNNNYNHDHNNQTSDTSIMRIFNNPSSKSTIPFEISMHDQELSHQESDIHGGIGTHQEQVQQGLTSNVRINNGNGNGYGSRPSGYPSLLSEELHDDDLPPIPLPPTTQHGHVVVKALTRIAIGMAVVIILAHPLVACFYEISYRFAVPPFYTAFVLGPLIGDSGVRVFDVIKYAKFKTAQTTSVALTALYVSAAISNTFVFGVLVAIVFNRGIYYAYCAETMVILLVVGWSSLIGRKAVPTLRDATWALAMYPLSLVAVAVLRSVGFD